MRYPQVMNPSNALLKALLGMVLLGALGFALGGCAQDQTEDAWRRAKVAEQLAKVGKIEGTYRGQLESRVDRGTMGALTVEMHPDTRIQDSSDRLNSEQKAIVRGVVTYSGTTQASAVFDQGFYDDLTGILKISFTVLDASGAPVRLNLSGSVQGDVFSGQIEADGFSKYGASFSLGRDVPGPIDSRLTSGQAIEPRDGQKSYKGTYLQNGESREVRMTLVSRRTTAEQVLVDLFSPIRKLHVTLDFGRWDVFFEAAELDERSGNLIAQTVVNGTSAAEKYALSLECTKNGAGFGCTLKVAGKKQREVVFTPDSAPAETESP